MVKNINREISAYREAIRHLWNTAFLSLEEAVRLGPSLENYEEIERLLFDALVCNPNGFDLKTRKASDPINQIRLKPISPDVPVLINRCKPASGYWDDPKKHMDQGVELAMIEFFDWDGYQTKNCSYYRFRILDWPKAPDLIGRDGLVEVLYVDAFYRDL